MDSNSIKYPFYRVFDENGEQYCDCGWEQHAQELIILNQTCSLEADRKNLTYRRIDAPKPINPETVDVGVIPVEETIIFHLTLGALRYRKILMESLFIVF